MERCGIKWVMVVLFGDPNTSFTWESTQRKFGGRFGIRGALYRSKRSKNK